MKEEAISNLLSDSKETKEQRENTNKVDNTDGIRLSREN